MGKQRKTLRDYLAISDRSANGRYFTDEDGRPYKVISSEIELFGVFFPVAGVTLEAEYLDGQRAEITTVDVDIGDLAILGKPELTPKELQRIKEGKLAQIPAGSGSEDDLTDARPFK